MPMDMNMLSQYLSGMGAGLNKDPWVQNLNKITQENISAKSQAGLIDFYRQILSGKMPGAKANLSEKGMNLTLPSNALGGLGGGEGGGGGGDTNILSGEGGGTEPSAGDMSNANAPVSNIPNNQQKGGFLSSLLNPSVSQPGAALPSLAGLTPQDISAALGGAVDIEQLRQKQIMDTFAMNQPAKPVKADPLSNEFPIQHPEAGPMSLRQWNALPSSEKEFSAYISGAKKLGAPAEELTREFFNSLEPTDREQFMRAAMEDPELMQATKELAKSGATKISLGEKLSEKKALANLQGQLYFKDPDWVDDLSKHMSSKDVRSTTLFADDPITAKAEEKIKFIESKISAGGGSVQDVKFGDDGKTMIWTIKWPSGDTEVIKYAIRN